MILPSGDVVALPRFTELCAVSVTTWAFNRSMQFKSDMCVAADISRESSTGGTIDVGRHACRLQRWLGRGLPPLDSSQEVWRPAQQICVTLRLSVGVVIAH